MEHPFCEYFCLTHNLNLIKRKDTQTKTKGLPSNWHVSFKSVKVMKVKKDLGNCSRSEGG